MTKNSARRSENAEAGHEKLGEEIQSLLEQAHDDGKEPNPMAKGMSWMKTNVKLAMDASDETAADLITDGCNMGVKSLSRYLNQYKAASEEAKRPHKTPDSNGRESGRCDPPLLIGRNTCNIGTDLSKAERVCGKKEREYALSFFLCQGEDAKRIKAAGFCHTRKKQKKGPIGKGGRRCKTIRGFPLKICMEKTAPEKTRSGGRMQPGSRRAGSRRSKGMDINKSIKIKNYNEYVKQKMPKSKVFLDCIKAFFVGGAICTVGQGLRLLAQEVLLLDDKGTAAFVAMVLVFLGALFTGLGLYDVLGNFAGAGSIVPITGFANSIVSPAMEYKREGMVLGVGAKLFSIAGPVLVYGISASVLVGIIYFILHACGVATPL